MGEGETGGPLGDTEYQRVSARVLSLANRLRALGVDSVLQVPTLVIAGDQSFGKSSVVEAIAGVALPRSDGTCTRCPTEVRMRADILASAYGGDSSPPIGWSCDIKLCRDYDADGMPLLEKPPEEHFCTVRDKAHIAACVTAAQAVLLNPKAVGGTAGGVSAFVPDLSGKQPSDPQALRALGGASRYELGFTANKVILEISGAEADLTIIDLPGIIHSHDKGRQYVETVERMTKDNLAPEHHIIAMALPAGLDPETQAIRLWVREADPSGSRSIGIITKPDIIKEDEHTAQRKLIELVGGRAANGGTGASSSYNGNTDLKLGYYVVKNPGQEALNGGITFPEAREAEKAYFVASPHWSQAVAATPSLAQRLGADHLRAGLSALLVERIEAQLPAMRRSAREQLTQLSHELSAMPPAPSDDPLQEIRTLVWKAAEKLDGHIQPSVPGHKAFYQRVLGLYRTYGEQAIRSTPAFLVGRTLISALNNSDKGLEQQQIVAAGGQPVHEEEIQVPCFADEEATKALAENEALQSQLKASLFPTKHMTLRQVQEMRDEHRGRELPTFSPYSAVEELIRKFKGRWAEHAEAVLGEVTSAAYQLTDEVVSELFGRYPKAHRLVSNAFSEYLEALSADASQKIEGLIGMEDEDIFTLNSHYLSGQLSIFLGRLKRAYLRPRDLSPHELTQVTNLLSQLSAYGVSFKSYESLFVSQPTPVDDVLQMMAACLAYFKVAFKRVQDGVPMHIRSDLLRRLADRRGLEAAVMRHMMGAAAGGEDGGLAQQQQQQPNLAEVARELMGEDPVVASRRTQRRDMERRLKEALALLHSPLTQQA